MRLLVDNMVPRGVTLAFREEGHSAVEVRAVLGQQAEDAAVAAYALAQGYAVVTHDSGLVNRCRTLGIPHVILRTNEVDDRRRIIDVMGALDVQLGFAGLRAIVTKLTFRME